MGGSVRTAPDASFVQPTSDAETVSDERARACSRLHADHRLPPALAARPRPRARGTPGGGHGAAGRDVRLGRGTADAPKPPPTRADLRRRWTAAQPTPVPIMPIMPIMPIPPTVPIMPIMPIMLCRQGRSVRHAQRIAQLEIRRAVRARGGAAALRRHRRGACFRSGYARLSVPLFSGLSGPFVCVRVCVSVRVCVCR